MCSFLRVVEAGGPGKQPPPTKSSQRARFQANVLDFEGSGRWWCWTLLTLTKTEVEEGEEPLSLMCGVD